MRTGWRASIFAGQFVDPVFYLMQRDLYLTILGLQTIKMTKGVSSCFQRLFPAILMRFRDYGSSAEKLMRSFFNSSVQGAFLQKTRKREQQSLCSKKAPERRYIRDFSFFYSGLYITSMSLNGRQKLAAEKSMRPNVPNEIGHFALGDSFAHIRPCSDKGALCQKVLPLSKDRPQSLL